MFSLTAPSTMELDLGSFRDPSGCVFRRDGELFRNVEIAYARDYDMLMKSGLYESLTKDHLLIDHEELPALEGAYMLLKPRLVEFISYPQEWCFSQLKDAALTTLKIQKRALEFGMSLKDASAFNIQFIDGRALLIDTLSLTEYKAGEAWVAYRQFCQHFVAPLALMTYSDLRLNQLFITNIDGVPLDMAAKVLPWRARLNLKLLMHLFMHAEQQKRHSEPTEQKVTQRSIPKEILIAMIDDLTATIESLRFEYKEPTEWSDYYSNTNYNKQAASAKEDLVRKFLQRMSPKTVWDLGANVGNFSRIAAGLGAKTMSMDYDPVCVELNYLKIRSEGTAGILPLVMDLTAPTPRSGWANEERMSIRDRAPADTLLCLAVIHHLAIGNNLPFKRIASFFASIGNSLVIEFVPKQDSQVKRLLSCRQDIFGNYDEQSFEKHFSKYFIIEEKVPVPDSVRTMYLMTKRKD